MCGIAGVVSATMPAGEAMRQARYMASTLIHRGPDDEGTLAFDGGAFGFRRLAILDLTAEGAQPMASASGRCLLVFNGEIYNFEAIRRGLPRDWRGHSDTEVLVEAVDAWGIERTVAQLHGMFALAVWDTRARILHLARDRAGEKPLYFCDSRSGFWFASELKAFAGRDVPVGPIDEVSARLMLRFSYVPAPRAIYENVRKVVPGTIISKSLDAASRERVYWTPATLALAPRRAFAGGIPEAAAELDGILGNVVSREIVADVPVGAFLSGGIDSSLIVAQMKRVSENRVRTFTIGFDERLYDESPYARAVARHLGTEHTELTLTASEIRDVIPSMPRVFDEPFGDSSQIPTYFVSKLARQSVTVALSGDGGDELFGGYQRHVWAQHYWPRLLRWPGPARGTAAALLRGVPIHVWDRLSSVLSGVLPARMRLLMPGDKAHKVAAMLRSSSLRDAYTTMISAGRGPVGSAGIDSPRLGDLLEGSGAGGGLQADERVMLWDLMSYLPGDILAKVDRSSMAVSLETRAPLLDHEVIEWAWSLPPSMRVSRTRTKIVLREVLKRYVPDALVERPKMGFALPIGEWLRGPLQDWATSVLFDDGALSERFVDRPALRKLWDEHVQGSRNREHVLWNVLMLNSWSRESRTALA